MVPSPTSEAALVFTTPVVFSADLVPSVDASVRRGLGGGARLVIDLASTTFLASAALSWLIQVGKRLPQAGGAFALARPGPGITKLLRAVHLATVLPTFTTLEEALAHATGVASPRSDG